MSDVTPFSRRFDSTVHIDYSASMASTAPLSVDENKKLAWREYLAGSLRVGSRPFKASIEITRNCNYKCVMCPQSWRPEYRTYHPEYNMTPELFGRVVKELFPHLEHVNLHGYGESIISPHWLEILDQCAPYAGAIRFALATNLSRVHDDMWRKMIASGFVISASIDGATKATFESIRVNGRFEDILHNLETIRVARREHGRGKLGLLTTLQKRNYREMPDFIDLAARAEANFVTFASVMESPVPRRFDLDLLRRMARMGLGGLRRRIGAPRLTLYDLPPDELSELKRETLKRAKAAGISVKFNDAYLEKLDGGSSASPALERLDLGSIPHALGVEESTKVSVYQRCFKPFSYVVVNHKGDIGLCNHLITDGSWKQMGNLEESTFEDIWNSTAYEDMRRKLLNAEPDTATCRWCFAHRLAD